MGEWCNKKNPKQLNADIQIYIFKTSYCLPPPTCEVNTFICVTVEFDGLVAVEF